MDNMEVELSIVDNPLGIPVDDLFEMAPRVNKKRGFLFVSKVLGKHIPVNPIVPLLTSGLMAIKYYESKTGKTVEGKSVIVKALSSTNQDELETAYSFLNNQQLLLKEDSIIIGFAETATALGHGVFDCFDRSFYVHTTREGVRDASPTLTFEEEHSHAVDQRCFANKDLLQTGNPIILVDDEITTGKTALNIIKDIQSKFPRKEYAVLSILDWRATKDLEQFNKLEAELGIKIRVVSLLSGQISFKGKTLDNALYDYKPKFKQNKVELENVDLSQFFTSLNYQSQHLTTSTGVYSFIKETGRFGIVANDQIAINTACHQAGIKLKDARVSEQTLCIGTGELMYLPMKIAANMGDGIYYHSSTRSPIHPIQKTGYAIQNGFSYSNPENQSVTHYIYNIPEKKYGELFFFVERPITKELLNPILTICQDRGIRKLNIVSFSKGSELNA